MPRHHYVPQFMLSRWATNGKLVTYQWHARAGKVLESAASVRSVCQIEDLNAFYGLPKDQKYFPEDWFTKNVDTPAARALTAMISGRADRLPKDHRAAWAKLLLSFAVRTPEALRMMGVQETRKAFDAATGRAKGPPHLEAKVTAIIKANMPKLERNFPLNAAMEIVSQPVKQAVIEGMHWWCRRFDRHPIIVGDRPLLTHPRQPRPCGVPLDAQDLLIALPIAPNLAFFAASNTKTRAKIRNTPLEKLARIINEETIWRATDYVFAHNRAMRDFLTGRLEGKAAGTWHPRP